MFIVPSRSCLFVRSGPLTFQFTTSELFFHLTVSSFRCRVASFLSGLLSKLYAFLKAQRSFAHGRSPRLIAGYMNQLKQDIIISSSSHHAQAVNVALALLVMGEDEQRVEEGPHGYRFRDKKGNESLVTIGKVQIMSSMDGVLSSWPPLNDLCLSFSLFKLLRIYQVRSCGRRI